MKKIQCLRCQKTMKYMGEEDIQLGQTGWIVGSLPNLLAGSMNLSVYVCPKCGKVEFFCTADQNQIAQTKCPKCGGEHDIDYPSCPYCKHRYS